LVSQPKTRQNYYYDDTDIGRRENAGLLEAAGPGVQGRSYRSLLKSNKG
jgi:hypothetical protein